jgi:hypothetical protein
MKKRQNILDRIKEMKDAIALHSQNRKHSPQKIEQLRNQITRLEAQLKQLDQYQQRSQGSGQEVTPILNIEETTRALQGVDTDLFSPLEEEAAQSRKYRKLQMARNLHYSHDFIEKFTIDSSKVKAQLESFLKMFSTMPDKKRKSKATIQQKTVQLLEKWNHYKWIARLHEKMGEKSPNVIQKSEGFVLLSASLQELEYTEQQLKDTFDDSEKKLRGIRGNIQKLEAHEQPWNQKSKELVRLEVERNYEEGLNEIMRRSLENIKKHLGYKEFTNERLREKTFSKYQNYFNNFKRKYNKKIDFKMRKLNEVMKALKTNDSLNARVEVLDLITEIGGYSREMDDYNYASHFLYGYHKLNNKIPPKINQYKECRQKIRSLLQEIEASPDHKRMTQIETELIDSIKLQHKYEDGFKLSEFDLKSLLEGYPKENPEVVQNKKVYAIEDMNEDELTFFEQEIENEIESLRNKIAQNLAKMVYYRRNKHKKNWSKFDEELKTNKEDYDFNAMFLAIQKYELQRIKNILQPKEAESKDSGEKGQKRREAEDKTRKKAKGDSILWVSVPTLVDLAQDSKKNNEIVSPEMVENQFKTEKDPKRIRQLEELTGLEGIQKFMENLIALKKNLFDAMQVLRAKKKYRIEGMDLNESHSDIIEFRYNEVEGLLRYWNQFYTQMRLQFKPSDSTSLSRLPTLVELAQDSKRNIEILSPEIVEQWIKTETDPKIITELEEVRGLEGIKKFMDNLSALKTSLSDVAQQLRAKKKCRINGIEIDMTTSPMIAFRYNEVSGLLNEWNRFYAKRHKELKSKVSEEQKKKRKGTEVEERKKAKGDLTSLSRLPTLVELAQDSKRNIEILSPEIVEKRFKTETDPNKIHELQVVRGLQGIKKFMENLTALKKNLDDAVNKLKVIEKYTFEGMDLDESHRRGLAIRLYEVKKLLTAWDEFYTKRRAFIKKRQKVKEESTSLLTLPTLVELAKDNEKEISILSPQIVENRIKTETDPNRIRELEEVRGLEGIKKFMKNLSALNKNLFDAMQALRAKKRYNIERMSLDERHSAIVEFRYNEVQALINDWDNFYAQKRL